MFAWQKSDLTEIVGIAHLRQGHSERVTEYTSVWWFSAQGGVDPAVMEQVQALSLLPDFWKHRVSR